jgi:hypothetical protein
MAYIYFEMDNLFLLIQWLRNHLAGRYTILVGRNTPQDVNSVLSFVIRTDLGLGMWLTQKMVSDEIRLMVFSKIDIPQGVEFG